MALKESSGLHSAEKLHTKALPKTAHAVFHRELSAALTSHLEKTVALLERLDRIVDRCGNKLKRMRCDARSGPREGVKDLSDEAAESPVRDAALVSSVHKAKHYATSTYALAAFASHLDHPEAVELLKKTLEEENVSGQQLAELTGQQAERATDATRSEAAESEKPAFAARVVSAHPL